MATPYSQRSYHWPEAGEVITPRQLQAARLLAKGWTKERIQKELSVKHSTVDAYITILYRKAGVDGLPTWMRRVAFLAWWTQNEGQETERTQSTYRKPQ